MPGGHECRGFFSGQVSKFRERFADELPPTETTPEESEAGFGKVSEAFGFYGTLDLVAKYVGQDEERLVKTWDVNRFYTKLKWMAWNEYTKKKYAEIMRDKK
jgi:hypothetical protein